MKCGAIILCGGKSSRMGRDKATLPFGQELMLQRVARLVGEAVPVASIVVVAAAEQDVSKISGDIQIVRDSHPYLGPLAAMAIGFRALANQSLDAVFLTGCDAPLLEPTFASQLFALLGAYDAVVPIDQGRFYPLAAAYRPTVLPHIERMVAAKQLRASDLFGEINALHVPIEELRCVDPRLASLWNVNSEEDYVAALEAAGF
jgi:molybdopterin-guanine dinucleotide biosynthesis protein A